MSSSDMEAESPSQIAQLIVAAHNGSAEALGQLMQFSRQYLLVIASNELPGELQAKGGASDLVQETQMDAVRGFDVFRGQTAAELLGWLREILVHNIHDFTRHYHDVAKRQVTREMPLNDAASGESQLVTGKAIFAEQPSAPAGTGAANHRSGGSTRRGLSTGGPLASPRWSIV